MGQNAGRIQEAVRSGDALTAPEQERQLPDSNNKLQMVLFFGAAVVFLVFFLLMLISRQGGGDQPAGDALAVGFETTPTLRYTPTPSPIALEEQDVIIRDGVRDRAPAYPVNLQILPAGQSQPRVFVVQRRKVEVSEWDYDSNPDTASFIHSLSVRPVIGIPWSEENAALFESLGPGTTFSLRLNTGAVQKFEFASQIRVNRSDTSAFRQVEPGLVLVLIGEHDERGAPTASRQLVLATYPPEQELSRDNVLASLMELPVPAATPTPHVPTLTPIPARDRLHVDVVTVQTIPGRMTIQLRIYNSQSEAVQLEAEDFSIALGYAPQPPGPWTTAEELEAFTLLPGQAVDLTLSWTWAGEPYAQLQVLSWRFAVEV